MTKVLTLIITIVVLLCIVVPAQSVNFRPEQLTRKGRTAYDRLFSACVFRIGGVGYAGATSQEELALYDLLEEERAVEALKSLVTAGSYEGGLYGLLGLSFRNNGEFTRAVDIYNARKDARVSLPQNLFECNIDYTEKYVGTQRGCILGRELRTEVVTDIQSGRYDTLVSPKYRPHR